MTQEENPFEQALRFVVYVLKQNWKFLTSQSWWFSRLRVRLPAMVLLGCVQMAGIAQAQTAGNAAAEVVVFGYEYPMARYLTADSTIAPSGGQVHSNTYAIYDTLQRLTAQISKVKAANSTSASTALQQAELAAAGKIFEEYQLRVSELRQKFSDAFVGKAASLSSVSVRRETLEAILAQGVNSNRPSLRDMPLKADAVFALFDLGVTKDDFQISAIEDGGKLSAGSKLLALENSVFSKTSVLNKMKTLDAVFKVLRESDNYGIVLSVDLRNAAPTTANGKVKGGLELFHSGRLRMLVNQEINRRAPLNTGGPLAFVMTAAGLLVATSANAGETKALPIDGEPVERPVAREPDWARVKPAHRTSN